MVWEQLQSVPSPNFSTSFANRGKIRKLVADAKNASLSKLELPNFPGGPEAFELAAKFCYGFNFEITTTNVAPLRCAADYLEMTEDYREENLVQRTETYLTQVVCQSLDNQLREQLASGLSRLDCDSGSLELKDRCLEWWVEDLSVLGINFYHRVISAMGQSGVRTDSIVASLMHYAQTSLKGIGKPQIWNPARANPSIGENGQKAIV
ncbi:UNVERIFIED_CONTAM: BTB/POZ domain-containing protein [Sesamum angustifolium]|uniref:BTB/POZ domain-containing protein n=1 Tax=Sesamum angustifolium TaxID=2727405 RepID=A0AAW2IL07_9LAMI